jgi:hypothetical protein
MRLEQLDLFLATDLQEGTKNSPIEGTAIRQDRERTVRIECTFLE